MRRITLMPRGARLESPSPVSLFMDEHVWEQGYSRIMGLPASGPLRRFWQHYYGASAEMVISGGSLIAMQQEITAAMPHCNTLPEVQQFLGDLAALCGEAQAQRGSLQVIAD